MADMKRPLSDSEPSHRRLRRERAVHAGHCGLLGLSGGGCHRWICRANLQKEEEAISCPTHPTCRPGQGYSRNTLSERHLARERLVLFMPARAEVAAKRCELRDLVIHEGTFRLNRTHLMDSTPMRSMRQSRRQHVSAENRITTEVAVKMVDKVETPVVAIRREAEVMKSLSHPNIVRFHAVFFERCFVCIVMDKYAGGDLVEGMQHHHEAKKEKLNGLDIVHISSQ
ncbi:unnamed protein product, partial [Polarella glacialis]